MDRVQPSGTPDDGFMVFRPVVPRDTRVYAQGILGIAISPLRKESLTDNEAVRRRMDTPIKGQIALYAATGIEFLGRFSVNLLIPLYPYQFTGADPNALRVGQGGISDAHGGIGDLRLDGRAIAWQSPNRKTAIGATIALSADSGNQATFTGDTGWTAMFLGSFAHEMGPFHIAAHLGPHFRPRSSIGGSEGDLHLGNELRYAFGFYYPMPDNLLRLGAEIWGSTSLEDFYGKSPFFHERNTTIEWLGQARMVLDRKQRLFGSVGAGTRMSGGYGAADFRVLAGFGSYWMLDDFEPNAPPPKVKVIESKPEYYDTDGDGDGYPDAIDGCPQVKEDGLGPNKSDGCPAPADSDKDGIPDSEDKCPQKAEDFDGILDKDGCPEEDGDKDAVLDVEDACPDEPGPPNADEGVSGCPTLTKLGDDGKVQILKPIEFDRGKATIQPISFPILDEVVTLMKARADMRVAIYGHTDNIGSHDYNVNLSRARAQSVKEYLQSKGIAADRLESDGFGPDKPLGPNTTAEGRAKNRRVEFVVLGAEEEGGDWKE